jgi:hypothetical protein
MSSLFLKIVTFSLVFNPLVEAIVPTTTSSWTSEGCYIDSVQARILTARADVNGPMTIEACQTACETAGYKLAGLEYAQECYCGNIGEPHIFCSAGVVANILIKLATEEFWHRRTAHSNVICLVKEMQPRCAVDLID